MKKNLFKSGTALLLALIVVFVTQSGCKNNTTNSKPEQLGAQNSTKQSNSNSKNTMASYFTLMSLEGKKVSLSDFKGKNIYVNFFATWCGPCVKEMPEIQKIYEKYKSKDLVVLAVDIGEKESVVRSYIDKNKYTFPVLLDPDSSTSELYNLSSIPLSVFIDEERNIVAKQVGAMREADFEKYIKLLLES